MAVRKKLLSSLVVMLFGIGFLLYDLKYPLDTWGNPGPAVFPLMAGAVLVILAFRELARDLLNSGSASDEDEGRAQHVSLKDAFRTGKGEAKVLVMIAAFVVYVLMIKWLGFFVSNFFFVIVASRLIGARNWRGPVALSAGISLFCYLLFDVWLKLSFPRGIVF
jgi:hypothetical protein